MKRTYYSYDDFLNAISALETLELPYSVCKTSSVQDVGFGSECIDAWAVEVDIEEGE